MKIRVLKSPEDPERRIVIFDYGNWDMQYEMRKEDVKGFVQSFTEKKGVNWTPPLSTKNVVSAFKKIVNGEGVFEQLYGVKPG